jgi:hypothetical protein
MPIGQVFMSFVLAPLVGGYVGFRFGRIEQS